MTATRNDSSPRTLQREVPEGPRAARAVDDDHALTDGASGDVEAFTRLVERHRSGLSRRSPPGPSR